MKCGPLFGAWLTQELKTELKRESDMDRFKSGLGPLIMIVSRAKEFGLAMLEGLQATEHSLARSHY